MSLLIGVKIACYNQFFLQCFPKLSVGVKSQICKVIGYYRPANLLSRIFLRQSLVVYNTLPKQTIAFTCLWYKSYENTVGKGRKCS